MRRMWFLPVFVCAIVAPSAQAVIIEIFEDEFDDFVSVMKIVPKDDARVEKLRGQIGKMTETFYKLQEDDIEKLLGKPAPKMTKTFALPVAHFRIIARSGRTRQDEKLNKDHTEFYPVDDVGGFEILYGIDGKSPAKVALYLKVDNNFRKLTTTNLAERLAWDRERFDKLAKIVERRRMKK